jgi:hypothetical protein
MQNKNHILTRWGLMLQEYNLIIKYIKCKDNFIANVFSRVGLYCDELKQRFMVKRGDFMWDRCDEQNYLVKGHHLFSGT